MNLTIELFQNKASEDDILKHLLGCDSDFLLNLTNQVDITEYAKKIFNKAVRFESWEGETLIGLVAIYCNDQIYNKGFITSVSVLPPWQGKKIAKQLINQCVAHAAKLGMNSINLEVASENTAAINLYKKTGFIIIENDNSKINMSLFLSQGKTMTKDRDFNAEIKDTTKHQYAYRFDFDIMHPFMIMSFEPFFKKGSLLELGSFKGDLTKRLLPYFDDVTCVEASDIAMKEARNKLGDKVEFVNSLFEKASLKKRYDNIVLTHVLEHLDDPILVLKRINNEWLAESGRFFLVCPNANAPSRQIAVKMGLISHNSAVTEAEAEHGHRCTYTLDTLERDAVAAGLKVVHRSGIFFKALANFQWDRLLQTDIISPEYLDGCYKLGQQYPDLCSSIFLMCEKGK